MTISRTRWRFTWAAGIFFLIDLLGVSFQQGWVHALDRLVIGWVRQPLPTGVTQTIIGITHSGDPKPVTWVTLLLVAILVIARRYRGALFLAFNVLVWAGIGNSLIKHLVQRPRPTVNRLVAASSYSFPSGHSITAMLLWGSLIVLLGWSLRQRPWRRRLVVVVLSLWIVCIGLSRIYVGVHYPTDVLGGWSLGFCLLTLSQWFLTRYGDVL
ncbi:MAG: phosphatase PAP2 family protein [Levilactobacillus sp.]|jgi:undecaprenyl-diphosphatase|uniref:phosphatase PAP2 family protein n=1 Tax=Levilactobacillus sp. TaxID=2767919 RepID=UPI0025880915|nr:phosphatase PAP2 family protein [Levilactobacillus sp.]MCH4123541.1 phosphatase PAP2 family protein [Levilactobacillus sp.]MCI1552321.1 phosphatase PAP2 family protein [Levilactobacillus sp.]MCI1598719.1 phosphatase PAP2 family protein [Levilactobacillus sp.]MCI1606143.1 phosphatase PAP2 family protein [Levilactobacillus sp.]